MYNISDIEINDIKLKKFEMKKRILQLKNMLTDFSIEASDYTEKTTLQMLTKRVNFFLEVIDKATHSSIKKIDNSLRQIETSLSNLRYSS